MKLSFARYSSFEHDFLNILSSYFSNARDSVHFQAKGRPFKRGALTQNIAKRHLKIKLKINRTKTYVLYILYLIRKLQITSFGALS